MTETPTTGESADDSGGLGGSLVFRVERGVTAALLRIRLRAPFFATLAMHAGYRADTAIETAATDGRDVVYNPAFFDHLSPAELEGVLMHEVLHAALGHVPRRGARDPKRWNIAADIVVNGLLAANDFELPEGGVRDESLEDFSTEEVYVLLPRQEQQHELEHPDLLEPTEAGAEGAHRGRTDQEMRTGSLLSAERQWQAAVSQAASVARGTKQGTMPLGVERAFGLGDQPLVDWRAQLWRYLTPSATDFAAFDRRHVHQGLYLEALEAQTVRVFVCVDTSGSIDQDALAALMTETDAILRAYPGIECALYYADADLYGPYEVKPGGPVPPAQGGGGTDFRPFFAALAEQTIENGICVYLTDGFGDFPDSEPLLRVLWAVVPGGLDDEKFPFGDVVRIV